MATSTRFRLGQARRAFFERDNNPVGQIPDTILQSWRRCRRAGLAVDGAATVMPVSAPDLRQLRERHERLWRLAHAELEGLAGDAAASGSIVLLTDAAGWILDAEGNPGFLDRAGRIALRPGVCWGEELVGTNAIGTAIIEARAVEVRGGEHYLAPHGVLNCAACPIFEPSGQLVGVLDISGDARASHGHALALARRAVASIEHRWFDDGIAEAELLRLHTDPTLVGTVHEGLLAVRGGRLVAANRVGLQLFGLQRSDIGQVRCEALFAQSLTRLRQDGALFDRQQRRLYGVIDEPPTRARRASPPAPVVRPAEPARPASGSAGAWFDATAEVLLERARRVLDAGLPVLVQGETGTGKEVFARELHRRCARAGQAFVAVNCAALPETLIEAELFGYEHGAFTGARRQGSPGVLRRADGGVLFLDEIGDMPLPLQPRLLRVLQERELSPLGGGKPVRLDFVLVCATHQDLPRAIAEGRFRADLYYRIADHVVHLPSLRQQRDRGALVRALWAQLGQGRRLDDDALMALAGHDWPGNLRQLVACLRTLVALSEPGERLGRDSLPAPIVLAAGQDAAIADDGHLDSAQRALMRRALDDCGGNVSHAARRLGISRSTLYRRLQLGVERRANTAKVAAERH